MIDEATLSTKDAVLAQIRIYGLVKEQFASIVNYSLLSCFSPVRHNFTTYHYTKSSVSACMRRYKVLNTADP